MKTTISIATLSALASIKEKVNGFASQVDIEDATIGGKSVLLVTARCEDMRGDKWVESWIVTPAGLAKL